MKWLKNDTSAACVTSIKRVYLVTNGSLTFKATYFPRVLTFNCKSESVSASHAYYTVTSVTGTSLYSYFVAAYEPTASITMQSYTALLVMFTYKAYQLALLRLTVPASCHEQMKHYNQKIRKSHYVRYVTKLGVDKSRAPGRPGY